MSNIQDMNNRIKQNRNLRPSKRAKFKEGNRETIYAGANREDKAYFKDFSEFQIKKAINKIRENAKSQKRLELILKVCLFTIISLFVTYKIISAKKKPKKLGTNKSSMDYDTSRPIIWNGKQSDPLNLPFSNLYYAPKIGTLDFEIQIDKNYEVYPSSMIVDNTTNILFFDSICNLKNRLLPKDGYISWMYVGPKKEGLGPKKNLYALSNSDTNEDGLINHNDLNYLFISELDGHDLTKITERRIQNMEWIGRGNELLIEFVYQKEEKDSLYGIFNTETKNLRLTNQKVHKKKLNEKMQGVGLNPSLYHTNPWRNY